VCYCRVSSAGQKDDLQRQVEYMSTKYPGFEIITEIASGLNFHRKKLQAILRSTLQNEIETVVVAHRDRLARFGYPLIQFIFQQQGVELLCDDEDDHKSKEEELVEDILAIITVFSSRVYGARKYKKGHKNTKTETVSKCTTEEVH
jgi:predicted site-specific integrase-resolvase